MKFASMSKKDTHILFTEADDNTLGSHWADLDAILLDKNVFEKALSGDKIEQENLPLLLVHEASHALDNGALGMSSRAMTYSPTKNQRFIVSNEYTIGDIGQKIIDVYNSCGGIGTILRTLSHRGLRRS